jgi:carbon-monoxide dehydrogenase large subunit
MSSIRVDPETLSVLDRPNSYIGKTVPRPNLERLLQGRGAMSATWSCRDGACRVPALAACACEDRWHRCRRARQMPGVIAVVTGKELAAVITPWVGVLSHLKGLKSAPQSRSRSTASCWQGEAVRAIVATSRARPRTPRSMSRSSIRS